MAASSWPWQGWPQHPLKKYEENVVVVIIQHDNTVRNQPWKIWEIPYPPSSLMGTSSNYMWISCEPPTTGKVVPFGNEPSSNNEDDKPLKHWDSSPLPSHWLEHIGTYTQHLGIATRKTRKHREVEAIRQLYHWFFWASSWSSVASPSSDLVSAFCSSSRFFFSTSRLEDSHTKRGSVMVTWFGNIRNELLPSTVATVLNFFWGA